MATTSTDTIPLERRSRCRACDKCERCCDWYFIGTTETWNWIRNYENWKENDWERWCNNHVWEQFKLRDDSTCVPKKKYPNSFSSDRLPFVPTRAMSSLGGVHFRNLDTHFLCTNYQTANWLSGPPTRYVERLSDYDFGGKLRHVFYMTLSFDVCLCEDNQTS